MAPHPLPGGKGLLVTVRPSIASQSRIAVTGPEGGAPRQILDGTQARYSQSGHILYTTVDGTLLAAPFDLESLEPGPAVPVASDIRILGNSATQFAISASGSLVYQTAPNTTGRELVWVDRDGNVETIDPEWVSSMAFPALSPDGSAVAVDARGELWVKRLPGGVPLQLTFDGRGPYRPGWTPAGDSVLAADGALYTLPLDGGQPVRTHTDEREIAASAWSPRGDWLVYRTNLNREGRGDIKGLRPGVDSVAVALAASPGRDLGPTVSPDGRWLAYFSDESGSNEVYVVPLPNTDERRWQVSDGGGAAPQWAREGTELYYVREQELVAVQVETDPTFRVLSSSVVVPRDVVPLGVNFLDQPYDVAPDGRFLMLRPVGEQGPSRVILVQNLFELLE
jgi:Tol biopolymer transport system component